MNRKNVLKIIFFICLAVAFLSLILFSRTSDGMMIPPGEETYEHLNSAKAVSEDGASSHLFYDVVLAWLLDIMSLSTAMIVVPGVFLIVTLILFSQLLRHEDVDGEHITYALALIILSPAFLMMYVGFSAYALTLTLVMAIAYLYVRRSSWYIAILPFLFLADRITGMLAIVLLVIFEADRKRTRQAIGISMTAIVLLLISGFLPGLSLHSLAPFFSIQVNELLSFFGGTYGYSFILLFLGILGMTIPKTTFSVSWKNSVAVLLLILSLFYDPLRILSMFVLVYYGAVMLKHFVTREWKVGFLRYLTIILLLCILVFSTSTTLNETIRDSPKPYEVEAAELIDETVGMNPELQSSHILAHPSYSDHVEFYTGLEALDDEYSAYDILTSQQYEHVKRQLQQNRISFIVIDKSRKEDNLWQRPEQGILFVLQNNRLFKKIYQQDEYEVYSYTEWDGETNSTETDGYSLV